MVEQRTLQQLRKKCYFHPKAVNHSAFLKQDSITGVSKPAHMNVPTIRFEAHIRSLVSLRSISTQCTVVFTTLAMIFSTSAVQ